MARVSGWSIGDLVEEVAVLVGQEGPEGLLLARERWGGAGGDHGAVEADVVEGPGVDAFEEGVGLFERVGVAQHQATAADEGSIGSWEAFSWVMKTVILWV